MWGVGDIVIKLFEVGGKGFIIMVVDFGDFL